VAKKILTKSAIIKVQAVVITVIIVIAVIAGVAYYYASLPRPTPTPTTIPIKVGLQLDFAYTDLLVACYYGFFEKEGLIPEVHTFRSPAEIRSALAAGDIDISQSSLFTVLKSVASGIPLLGVAYGRRGSQLYITVRSDLPVREGHVEDLKGLKIGVTSLGATTDIYLRYLLKNKGIDPDKDVTILATGVGAAMIAALQAGTIDAFVVAAPAPQIAAYDMKIGKIILRLDDYSPFSEMASGIIVTTYSIAKNKPEMLRAVVRALIEASKALRGPEGPRIIRELLTEKLEFSASEECIAKIVEDVIWHTAIDLRIKPEHLKIVHDLECEFTNTPKLAYEQVATMEFFPQDYTPK